MKLTPLILAALLTACASTSTQRVSFLPEPNSVIKVSASTFWDGGTVMLVFGPDAKLIAAVPGETETAAAMFASAANAAILSSVIPMSMLFIGPSTKLTLAK